jgi:2-phosphosulfolactate phosphatase
VPPDATGDGAFDIRFEWGSAGIEAQAAGAAVVAVVDVLRFTTAVDAAVSTGAHVYPYRWPDPSAPAFAASVGARLADPSGTSQGALTLSPHTLRSLAPGDTVVLPSPNSATCARCAADVGVTVVAACLRNVSAIAAWLNRHRRPVLVVACGERWPDGSLRPAIEDLLGAGALIGSLEGHRSPDAEVAAAAWSALGSRAPEVIAASTSGRELVGAGFADDVAFAGEVDVSRSVPVLHDGPFVDDASSKT